MKDLRPPTGPAASVGLVTDLYQLTMASGYWKTGLADREAVFHLFFRESPFGGGFALACGLEQVLSFLDGFRFGRADLDYLAEQRGNDGRPLFDPPFLDHLGGLELSCDLDAMPEGTVVFPQEPLLRLRGPLLQGQILETALLNLVSYQTLIATKAARVCLAARGDAVLEFGLRRAQGLDGGLSASRAAYVGGCAATSNVLAGKQLGIPIKGTHAHSWVMSFPGELEAFAAYAEALPNNCIFLVDTYDTLGGVRNAVRVGRELRSRGHEMAGIRLDSGDLATLSRRAREILDEGGFPKAAIVASNDLDEHAIVRLKEDGAAIDLWGVGTKLVTAYDQPALGAVFKLGAWRREDGSWQQVLKLSEDRVKSSNPGVQQVRRFHDGGRFKADVIFDEVLGISDPCVVVGADGREHRLAGSYEDLLEPVVRDGKIVRRSPQLGEIRRRALGQQALLEEGVRRLTAPAPYPVGLDQRLYRRKAELAAAATQPSAKPDKIDP